MARRKQHPLLQYADKFIEFIDITEKSKRSYESILNLYIDYLENKNIMHATRKDIIRFRNSLLNKGLSVNTVRKTISVLKGFYQYLSYNQMRFDLPELYVKDLTYGIKNPVVSKNIKKLPLTKKHLDPGQ